MRYDAIVFDLFGTLVPTGDLDVFLEDHCQTAVRLGVDVEDYVRAWFSKPTTLKRTTGGFANTIEAIKDICNQLNVNVSDEVIRWSAASRIEVTRQVLLKPRADALGTLEAISQRGLQLGMISDCSTEVPLVWPETDLSQWFNATIFSCNEGTKKPDPRLYAMMCRRLSTMPEKCLFVGDGACPELTGAQHLGMDAALICPPDEAKAILNRAEGRNWKGKTVASLTEVLDLI